MRWQSSKLSAKFNFQFQFQSDNKICFCCRWNASQITMLQAQLGATAAECNVSTFYKHFGMVVHVQVHVHHVQHGGTYACAHVLLL